MIKMSQFTKITLLLFMAGYIGCKTDNSFYSSGMPIPEVSSDDPATIPISRSDEEWWMERHIDRVESVVKNQKIILIGDSITQGWVLSEAWRDLNKHYANKITLLGFGADRTQNVIWRLENGEFPSGIKPENVILLIGTNNVDEPESIAAGIGRIIQIIHANAPSANIYLMALLPRGSGVNDEDTIRNYSVNKIIKNYDGYLNIHFMDIGDYFIDSNGQLIPELFTDNLHLSPLGYRLWKDKIIEKIE